MDETKLFDFIKIMFKNDSGYTRVKENNKRRHAFMINRFMSIQYPINSQAFNFNGINVRAVVDSWRMVTSRFNKVPFWIYTKTKKSAKNIKKSSNYIPPPEVLSFYMQKNEIGNREIRELEKFNKDAFYNDLKQLEKQMNVYE